eukprot:COSAG02_NODE_33559_length_498_cov_0.781955_2_plen_50_part_01
MQNPHLCLADPRVCARGECSQGKLEFDSAGKLLPLRWVDKLTINMALPQP